MSDLKSFDVEIDVNDERIEKPAKAWWNWRLALRDIVGRASGRAFRAGEIFPGAYAWPSKEIAEQKALDDMLDDFRLNGRISIKYLGAFPEGTRP